MINKTFAINRIDGEIYLCAEQGEKSSEILAKFDSEDAVREFSVILAVIRMSAKAAGASGI